MRCADGSPRRSNRFPGSFESKKGRSSDTHTRARTASARPIAGRWTFRLMCAMATGERAWVEHSTRHFSSSCVCKAFTTHSPASLCPTPEALAFTSRWDFETVGIYRHIGFKCGKWHDVAWYQLSLREHDRLSTRSTRFRGRPRDAQTGPLRSVWIAC